MIKKVFKCYTDYEKEEKWLTQMAKEGWLFEKYTFLRYTFRKSDITDYVYRIELLDQWIRSRKSQEYIRFLDEMGVEFVDSWVGWAYFRKRSSDGEFDLYTDYDSKIKHNNRLLTLYWLLAFCNFTAGFNNIFLFSRTGHWGFNFYIGILGLVVCSMLSALAYRTWKRIRKLKKEKELKEY